MRSSLNFCFPALVDPSCFSTPFVLVLSSVLLMLDLAAATPAIGEVKILSAASLIAVAAAVSDSASSASATAAAVSAPLPLSQLLAVPAVESPAAPASPVQPDSLSTVTRHALALLFELFGSLLRLVSLDEPLSLLCCRANPACLLFVSCMLCAACFAQI